MATLIRLKRRNKSGNNGVLLAEGEAYYNIADKHLYVGNCDNEDISVESKKHVAEITTIDVASDTISFQIGEDPNNRYTKKLNIETNNLWKDYEG